MLVHGHKSTKVLNWYNEGKYSTSNGQRIGFFSLWAPCRVNVVAAPKRNDWGLKFADIKSFVQCWAKLLTSEWFTGKWQNNGPKKRAVCVKKILIAAILHAVPDVALTANEFPL